MFRVTKDALRLGGPGEPPPGFVGARNSRSEWPPYWGLSKILGVPENPRRPPWIGEPGVWDYQSEFLPMGLGRGTNIDFVVYHGPKQVDNVAIRIQTEFFHIFADTRTQARDALQKQHIGSGMRVVDIYEQDYLDDPTGQQIIVLLRDALAGIERPDPILGARARRVRV